MADASSSSAASSAEPAVASATRKPNEATPLVQADELAEAPPLNSIDRLMLRLGEQGKVAVAIFILIGTAVLKTQLTALLFTGPGFPTFYSFYSCVVTCAILVPIFLLFPSQWGVPTREMIVSDDLLPGPLLLIVIFTSTDLGFTNIALSRISTALQQCIAASNPFWTLVLEAAIFGKVQHSIIFLTVIAVVSGAVLTSVSNINKVDTFGLFAAVAAVLSSASKYVFAHDAFKKYKGKIGPLALLFWVDIMMIPIYLVWTGANHELVGIFQEHLSANEWLQYTGTAALGGVRALTQYLVLIFVTASSMSTANIGTQILNILVSLTWQSCPSVYPPPPPPALPLAKIVHPRHYCLSINGTAVAGIVVVMITVTFYSYLKMSKDALGGALKKPIPVWPLNAFCWREKPDVKNEDVKANLTAP